jgi:hypothetical protein
LKRAEGTNLVYSFIWVYFGDLFLTFTVLEEVIWIPILWNWQFDFNLEGLTRNGISNKRDAYICEIISAKYSSKNYLKENTFNNSIVIFFTLKNSFFFQKKIQEIKYCVCKYKCTAHTFLEMFFSPVREL